MTVVFLTFPVRAQGGGGAKGEVLALRAHCVHTAEAEMGRVRCPKVQSNLWCDLLTVQWP